MDTVLMVHPNLSTEPRRVSRKSFEKVWKGRGWVEQEAEGFITPRWMVADQATEDEEE